MHKKSYYVVNLNLYLFANLFKPILNLEDNVLANSYFKQSIHHFIFLFVRPDITLLSFVNGTFRQCNSSLYKRQIIYEE